MKATDPYLLPYPECDPPLVKDSSDIVQMRELAQAIDARVTALFTEADDEFITPDGCKIARTVSQTYPDGSLITFPTVQFDNSPGAVMGTTTGIRIRQSGFYFAAGYVATSLSADLARIRLVVEGLGEVLNEGIGVGVGSGCHMVGSVVVPLQAGQLLQMFVDIGAATTAVTSASLACVRITGSS